MTHAFASESLPVYHTHPLIEYVQECGGGKYIEDTSWMSASQLKLYQQVLKTPGLHTPPSIHSYFTVLQFTDVYSRTEFNLWKETHSESLQRLVLQALHATSESGLVNFIKKSRSESPGDESIVLYDRDIYKDAKITVICTVVNAEFSCSISKSNSSDLPLVIMNDHIVMGCENVRVLGTALYVATGNIEKHRFVFEDSVSKSVICMFVESLVDYEYGFRHVSTSIPVEVDYISA